MSTRATERIETVALDPENPWLGLSSYTEETRAYFHGRDEEAAELARRVQRKLLTVLFGQSGLGKTSLLRAGLVPRLRGADFCPVYVRVDYAPHWRRKWQPTPVFLPGESQGQGSLVGCRLRSEERRVGKECRSRWSPYH